MKKIIFALALALLNIDIANAATYFVRPDGGTCGGTSPQCLGTSDSSYDGSGTGEACSCRHPYYVFGWYRYGGTNPPTGGQAGVMTGGDDVIIKPGSYQMGSDGRQNNDFGCGLTASYDCIARPIPSGTQANPTKIYGCSATGCTGTFGTSYPELWARGRISQILNLQSKSWIEIGWLNLTDHASCGRNHYTLGCGSSDIDELSGQDGIKIISASNITLKNLWIHGLWRYGLYGGGVNGLTIIDSKIDFNAFGGWNADSCGAATSCQESGTISFTGTSPPTSSSSAMSISWNGCIENPSSTGNAMASGCYSQSVGGYGDGIGTAPTAGAWTFTNADISHNTSDGIDLLYMNKSGVTGGTLTVKKSRAEGNIGNQVKGPNSMTLEDNIIIGNCGFFKNQSFSYTGIDACRAGGNTVVLAWRNNSAIEPNIDNNTITGNGTALILIEGPDTAACPSTVDINAHNNLLLGGRRYLSTSQKTETYYNSAFGDQAKDCKPELLLSNNACTGDFARNNCTATDSTTAYLQTAVTGNVYTATPTDVFTGTINQGPTTFYTGTDYIDQLTIKIGSIARDIADETVSGLDAYDFNNYNRGASWDSGGYEYGTTTGQPQPTCGDNNTDVGEVCDGTDLNDETCVTRGFTSGTLACLSNCSDYDTSSCVTSLCGNGDIDGNEVCDGTNLNGQTCASQGYVSGTLSCAGDCLSFVTTACVAATCGDGSINQGSETCDDGNTNNNDGCSSICQIEVAGLEKFLLYTETDPSSVLTVETHKSIMTGITHTTSTKLSKDFGASYFGDFTHRFTVKINSCNDNGAGEDGGAGLWALSSVSRADLYAIETANDGISFTLGCLSSSARYTWKLYSADNQVIDSWDDAPPVITRYVEIARSGSTITAKIYSDSAYTNLLKTLTVAGTATAYRYLYTTLAYNDSVSGTLLSGSAENFNLDAALPPPSGCQGTTIGLCTVLTSAHLATSGTCSGTGGCQYTCNNGTWVLNSDTCVAPSSSATISIKIQGGQVTGCSIP